MGALDHQLGIKDETVYGTAVTVDRFFEYNSESVKASEGRTESDPLRVGQFVQRSDRYTPWYMGAAGTVQMDVLTKGFGIWLKHMLGAVVTTGVGPYTHTGTMADLYGKSFTAQLARPLHPSGTVQPFTYAGGKVTSWTISNSVDAHLLLDLECDFASEATATALAAAAYPASMEPLSWVGGVVTVGGASFDVTEISIAGNNGLDTERRFIRGSSTKKEPTGARREVSFSMAADFDSLAQRNRVHTEVRADSLAEITGTWTNGTSSLAVTIPAGRFDDFEASAGGPEALSQSLSGVARYDGSNSPVRIVYTSGDAVA